MELNPFQLFLLLQRLEREQSFDACVQIVGAFGCSLVCRHDGYYLSFASTRVAACYKQLEVLIDDVLMAGRSMYEWL